MRLFTVTLLCLFMSMALYAQKSGNSANTAASQTSPDNIYTIKQQFLYQVLHNPNDKGNDEDNDLSRFNRWFNDMEPRCFPSGDIPRPDVLLKEMQGAQSSSKHANKQTAAVAWQPVGPTMVPSNFNVHLKYTNCRKNPATHYKDCLTWQKRQARHRLMQTLRPQL